MIVARMFAAVAIGVFLATPLFAAEDDPKAFGQFQELLLGIEKRSFEMIQDAINQTDLTNRILSHQRVAGDVEELFRNDFWSIVQGEFDSGFLAHGPRAKTELVQFAFENGQGRAWVRFSPPAYDFAYQVFDLRHDSRGRLKIVDWFDSSRGMMFSEFLGEELLTAKPIKETTRNLISINSPTDLQLFQVTELLKAIRDREAARFFEIYEQLDEQLLAEPWLSRRAVFMAHDLRDVERFAKAYLIFVGAHGENPNMALITSDFALMVQDYESAFTALQRFEQFFAVKEGALPAKLSALALATGKPEDAEKFAVKATVNEPELELGWWSLLRARAAVGDFNGSLEPLEHLEDDFSHRLDEAKLRRDKFRGFAELATSQEFKDWRASRD